MQLVDEQSNALHSPLAFQWDILWESALQKPIKSQCVESSSEDCRLVCNMIAPESGAELYKAFTSQYGVEPSLDLEALITACRNANTLGFRTQILSIYAFRYAIPVLNTWMRKY